MQDILFAVDLRWQNSRAAGIVGSMRTRQRSTSINHRREIPSSNLPAKAGSPKSRLHRITARWVLNISRRDNTVSLGSLFQVLCHSQSKGNFPLLFRWCFCVSVWACCPYDMAGYHWRESCRMRVLQILRILKISCKIITAFLLHLLFVHLLVALCCVSKHVTYVRPWC